MKALNKIRILSLTTIKFGQNWKGKIIQNYAFSQTIDPAIKYLKLLTFMHNNLVRWQNLEFLFC